MHNVSQMLGKPLTSETIVHDASSGNRLVEIVLRNGEPDDSQGIRHVIEECVEKHKPAAILLNLQEYRYFGGDYVSAFAEAFIDRDKKTARPACFLVRSRRKARSLESFFELLSLPGGIVFFDDPAKAIAFLEERLEDTG